MFYQISRKDISISSRGSERKLHNEPNTIIFFQKFNGECLEEITSSNLLLSNQKFISVELPMQLMIYMWLPSNAKWSAVCDEIVEYYKTIGRRAPRFYLKIMEPSKYACDITDFTTEVRNVVRTRHAILKMVPITAAKK